MGPKGVPNISPEERAVLIAEALTEKENNELLKVKSVEKEKKIEFHE